MKKNRKSRNLLLKNLLISSAFIMPILVVSCSDTSNNPAKSETSSQSSDKTNPDTSDPNTTTPSILFNADKTPKEITTINLEKLPIILKRVDHFSNYSNLSTNSINTSLADLNKQLEFATTNKDDNDQIQIQVENKKYLNNNPETSLEQGKLIFSLKISSKKNPNISITKDVEVGGFRQSRSSEINLNWANRFAPGSEDEFKQYFAENNYQRYETDAKKYFQALNGQLSLIEGKSPFDINSWRPDVKRTPEEVKKYDELAKQLKLDTYDDALKKGFTMPVYDDKGNVEGLKLYDPAEIPKGPAWWDVIGRNENQTNGLARYIPNEKYKQAALQTYSIQLSHPARIDEINPDELKAFLESQKESNNRLQKTARGTMWILDYAIPTDGHQPTKWYFGTNNHVVEEYKKDATGFSMSVLKPNVAIRTKLRTTKGATDESYITASFSRDDLVSGAKNDHADKTADYISPADYGIPGIRIVYRATDYLNTSPKDYLSKVDQENEKYKNAEEFLDFAVLEIDFSKFKVPDGYSSRDEFIKTITNDYYHNTSQHIKFLKTSYLKDYSRADTQLAKEDTSKKSNTDQFFIVGYPQATGDYFLDQYQDAYDYKNNKIGYSLWMNSESSFYNNLSNDENNTNSPENQRANKGNYFSLNIGYRSFADKPGLTDAFIATPKVGKKLHKSTVMSDPIHTKKVTKEVEENGKKVTKELGELQVANTKNYIAFGLEYLPRHYAPVGGASGSSIRNQNNELVGVYFASNETAKTGLAVAFRSEGFDYKGLYGKYNLPQYDLIYGGGKEQKTSFRQALETIYGTNFKTSLFKNGVNQIPDDYKFKNTDITTNTNPSTQKKVVN